MHFALDIKQNHELEDYKKSRKGSKRKTLKQQSKGKAKHDKHPYDISDRPALLPPMGRYLETNEITRIYATPLYSA